MLTPHRIAPFVAPSTPRHADDATTHPRSPGRVTRAPFSGVATRDRDRYTRAVSAPETPRWYERSAPLLVAGVAFASHLPALWAGFTQDDRDFVVRNPSIRSLPEAFAAFGHAFPPNDPERGLYRPLTNLSYAFDHLFGVGPRVPHLTNLLWFAGAAVLAHRLALLLRAAPAAALTMALLFAVHPVHCEAVDSIAGRSELLSLLFSSAALCVWARSDFAPGVRGSVVAAGFYALAVLSKESALVLPTVLGAACLSRRWPAERWRAWRSFPWSALALLALVGAACFTLRAHVLGRITATTTILGDAGLWTRLWTFGGIALEYARLLLIPGTLAPDFHYTHTVGIQATPTIGSSVGLALVGALLVAMVAAIRRGSFHALGLAILLGYLLPVSHIVPFGALMAERFLLLPSLGFSLCVGLWLHDTTRRAPRIALPAMAILLAVLSIRSVVRGFDWQDEVSLWLPVAAEAKNDYRVLNNLALGYLERGDVTRAKPLLKRSLTLFPGNRVALSNLGQILIREGNLDGARSVYEEALRRSPDYALGWSNLGVVELHAGRPAHAIRALDTAHRLDPRATRPHELLAQAHTLHTAASQFVRERGATREMVDACADVAILRQLVAACIAIDDLRCASWSRERITTIAPAH
jgi:hypothetical protein